MTKPKRIFLLFPLFLFFLCLAFPAVCAEGVQKGLSLSVSGALPSLFPSLVLSRMIVILLGNASGKRAVWAAFFMGLLCGFPVGAVGACSLYRSGALNRKEAENLLFFCNLAGPAFLIGFCGIKIFGDAKIGYLLFLLQSAAALFFLFFFFGKTLFEKEKEATENRLSPSLSFIITASLREAAHTFLYIASCILFFSFLSELIFHLFSPPALIKSILFLFMEFTSGCHSLLFLPKKRALFLAAAGCGWNGLSVHLQALSFLSEAGLSSKKYFLGKLTFAVLLPSAIFFLQKLL